MFYFMQYLLFLDNVNLIQKKVGGKKNRENCSKNIFQKGSKMINKQEKSEKRKKYFLKKDLENFHDFFSPTFFSFKKKVRVGP